MRLKKKDLGNQLEKFPIRRNILLLNRKLLRGRVCKCNLTSALIN